MRMAIVTHKNMISLGILAKELFIKNVLVINKDETYDTLQTIQEDTFDKIKALPIEGGFTEEIKEGAIKAFDSMNPGEKFLCINAWVTNYQSDEAKYYWEVQRLCNEGYTLAEATVLGNEWLESYRKEKAKG